MTPQPIGNVVAALQARAMIVRRPDPHDGRKVIVTMTAAGRRAFDERSHRVSEQLAQILFAEFNAKELRRLPDVLPLLDRLADRL